MFLPPVIVIKLSELERDISRFKHETLDEVDIAKLWKAFTSVGQYTVDPLVHACRLENFWWRVWGSKQKHLSGLELARLCSHLFNEGFNLGLRRKSDFTGESSSQTTITSYAGSNNHEKGQYQLASGLHTKISLENNTQPVLKKPISLSSQGSRSDALYISPNETEEGKFTANSVPCIVLQPSSINSCETNTERKRIFGPTVPKKRKKVLNKKKQPLVVRRFGSHLSTESVRIADGRTRRRIVKFQSKSDGVSVMNERSDSKLLGNNPKVPFAETRNSLAMAKLKSLNHTHNKMDSKKPDTISFIDDSKKAVFCDKIVKAGVSPVVRVLHDEVTRLGTNELVVQEKMNCTSQTNYLKKNRSTSNNQTSTIFKNSLNDSEHQSAISDTRDLDENPALSPYKFRDLDSNVQDQVDRNPITSETKRSDKIYKTSLKSPVATYNTSKPELLNKEEPRTIRSQMPLNIFAKRPVQPTFSLSESTDKLSISKSQLTLLIEKDRAKIGEDRLPIGK
ncbi:hypothetical protein OnM2_016027 [Erysiphe neolycopersici]|uniref:Uncharacterized protein n=1 Tax=Erysiphe neolycopersici TaxID=212602 RepID=A0A420I538_9PEZI|nr:hypothetical protein OnM2_016027 [Erysiphe neolycopersici]